MKVPFSCLLSLLIFISCIKNENDSYQNESENFLLDANIDFDDDTLEEEQNPDNLLTWVNDFKKKLNKLSKDRFDKIQKIEQNKNHILFDAKKGDNCTLQAYIITLQTDCEWRLYSAYNPNEDRNKVLNEYMIDGRFYYYLKHRTLFEEFDFKNITFLSNKHAYSPIEISYFSENPNETSPRSLSRLTISFPKQQLFFRNYTFSKILYHNLTKTVIAKMINEENQDIVYIINDYNKKIEPQNFNYREGK